jgi:sigma-B regulation protein RsbU (phosphoserine phosphatase)
MQILIADDDVVLRHALRTYLQRWDYEVVECADGQEAWDVLRESSPPPMAIMDWNMPGVDGPTLCQEVRDTPALSGMYIILLTSNASKKDMIVGLESGADDYIIKPFDWDELKARLRIGHRIVSLQQALGARVNELQQALSSVRVLSGLLPICAYCKRIRDDKQYWTQIEHYLSVHSDARFSHGICPECLVRVVDEENLGG